MKIVCLGDSLTFGYGLKGSEKWTNILTASTGHEFINAGINGDTTGGMLSRFNKDVYGRKPDVCFIMGQTNDFLMGCGVDTAKANIMALVQHCLAAGIRPVVGSSIPAFKGHVADHWTRLADFDEADAKSREMLKWYPVFTETFSVNYIDTFTDFEVSVRSGPEKYYASDGLHPNKEGSCLIADIIVKNLSKII